MIIQENRRGVRARDRKKRNIVIGVLCCLLVFMGVGYAILSQTLTINGIGNVKGN